jgi:hypothetical protein
VVNGSNVSVCVCQENSNIYNESGTCRICPDKCTCSSDNGCISCEPSAHRIINSTSVPSQCPLPIQLHLSLRRVPMPAALQLGLLHLILPMLLAIHLPQRPVHLPINSLSYHLLSRPTLHLHPPMLPLPSRLHLQLLRLLQLLPILLAAQRLERHFHALPVHATRFSEV